jgi:alkanesulfonate monooxygenase SsuD/methylene tetrahydromethanopterin reductase-like flavin-dependent oxidoreductase (luciferase family)
VLKIKKIFLGGDVKHFLFHFMPYKGLTDETETHGTAWVWAPNGAFDPEKARGYYAEYLRELVDAEAAGFDGVCVNEHHQTFYGLMPSPNIIASAVAARTSRVKIAVIGNALPLYNPPTRVAEEYAMLDLLSGGRLIAGMVVGGGPEYYSFSLNPAEARARFREAHDIIMGAWTRPGPWSFDGEHNRLRYVNTIPQPLQKPFPRVWIPGTGSPETMEFVAKRRYSYLGIPFFRVDFLKQTYRIFRDCCEKEGYVAHPEQMAMLMPIYVAETDAKAKEEFERHFWYFKEKLLPGVLLSPPGYTSPASAMRVAKAVSGGVFLNSVETWDDVDRGTFAIYGSPQTVAQKIIEHTKELGCGNLLGIFQLGDMPHEKALANARLYGEQVIPLVNRAVPDSDRPFPVAIPFPGEMARAAAQ